MIKCNSFMQCHNQVSYSSPNVEVFKSYNHLLKHKKSPLRKTCAEGVIIKRGATSDLRTKKHTFFGYNHTLGPLTWATVNPYFIQDCSHRTISNARNLRFHQPRSLWVKQNILLYLFNDLRKLYHT